MILQSNEKKNYWDEPAKFLQDSIQLVTDCKIARYCKNMAIDDVIRFHKVNIFATILQI